MAQIYKQQVQEQRRPNQPNTAPLEYFDKKRQAGLDAIDKMSSTLIEEQQKAAVSKFESTFDLAKMKMKSAMNQALEVNPISSAGYSEMATPAIQEIADTLSDGPEKVHLLAEMSIYNSDKSFTADINKVKADDKNRTMQINASVDSDVEDIMNNADQFVTDEGELQSPEQGTVSMMALSDLKRSLNAKDRNGNYVVSEAKRKAIEQKEKIILYEGLKLKAFKGYDENPEAAKEMLSVMQNNKEETLEKYGHDIDAYESTVAFLENLENGVSKEVAYAIDRENSATDEAFSAAYDVDKAKWTDKSVQNNPVALASMLDKFDDKRRQTPDQIKQSNKKKSIIEKQLVDVYSNSSTPKTRMEDGRAVYVANNASDVVLGAIDSHVLGINPIQNYMDLEGSGQGTFKRQEISDRGARKKAQEAQKLARAIALEDPSKLYETGQILSKVTQKMNNAGIDPLSTRPADKTKLAEFTSEASVEVLSAMYPEGSLAIIERDKNNGVPLSVTAVKLRSAGARTELNKAFSALGGTKSTYSAKQQRDYERYQEAKKLKESTEG